MVRRRRQRTTRRTCVSQKPCNNRRLLDNTPAGERGWLHVVLFRRGSPPGGSAGARLQRTNGEHSMKDPPVRGVVHLIEETKTFGQKGFRKRLVVLEQSKGTFTNYIPVDFLKDACDEVDGLSVGDEIEVTYRLSGRRWQRDEASEAKYFLSAEALSFRQLAGGKGPGHGGFSGVDPNDALAEAAQDDVPF